MTRPLPHKSVHPAAHALTIFRPVGEDGRAYTATTFPQNPWQGCEHFIRTCRYVGWIRDDSDNGYGVLDVLDENGDIVQDFAIVSNKAFQQIKRRLKLKVEDTAHA